MRIATLIIDGINPEPWTVGPLSIERRGNKAYPRVAKHPMLAAYQEALQENIWEAYPNLEMFEEDHRLELEFMFWRKLDSYKSPTGRNMTRHKADVTNLQKATEDALQGILFKNDTQVAHISSLMVEQSNETEPRIMIQCRLHTGFWNHDRLAGNYDHLERPMPPGNVLYVGSGI